MNLVKIVHPEAGESRVPVSSVPHWRRCGWELADEVAEAPQTDTPDGSQHKSKPSGRSRRPSNEGDA